MLAECGDGPRLRLDQEGFETGVDRWARRIAWQDVAQFYGVDKNGHALTMFKRREPRPRIRRFFGHRDSIEGRRMGGMSRDELVAYLELWRSHVGQQP
jgi:hypothetical protein